MPREQTQWVKGQSGNPKGSKPGARALLSLEQRYWLDQKNKVIEARKTFRKLVKIRDDMVLERKMMKHPETGEMCEFEVVPSIQDYIAVCREILDRTIGKPKQEIAVKGDDGKPLNWGIVLQQQSAEQANSNDLAESSEIEMIQEPKLIEHSLPDSELAKDDKSAENDESEREQD